jgi:hypothetical protein
VQDRPEQNAGHDAAVRGARDDEVLRRSLFADVLPEEAGSDTEIDTRAERDAAPEAQRREHAARVSKS